MDTEISAVNKVEPGAQTEAPKADEAPAAVDGIPLAQWRAWVADPCTQHVLKVMKYNEAKLSAEVFEAEKRIVDYLNHRISSFAAKDQIDACEALRAELAPVVQLRTVIETAGSKPDAPAPAPAAG